MVLILKFFFLILFSIPAFATLELSEEAIYSYNEARYEEAINLYKKILESEPKEVSLYLNLAIIYKDLAFYDEAIKLLENLEPKDKNIKFLLAKIYYLNGQAEKAMPYLEGSEDKNSILYLGLCSEDLGNLLEAKKYYSRVIEKDKNNIIALLRLAKIHKREKDFKGAIGLYERIKVLDPSIIEVNKILADLYLRIGKFPESYRAYTKAIAIEPKDLKLREKMNLVKNRLPKEFFEEERKKKDLFKKELSISIKPMEMISESPKVRVGVARIDSFDFKCTGEFEIKDKKGDVVFKGNKNSIYKIILDKKKKKISLRNEEELLKILEPSFSIKNLSDSEAICIFDLPFGEPGQFWARKVDRCFRRELEVDIFEDLSADRQDKLSLINILNLEEYLYGVLPAEMPFDSPFSALKAQAIVARTEALKKLGRHKKEGFDFCSDVHCQVYGGAISEKETTSKAVDETRGSVITYNDKPIDALYHANCGGHTQENIFGGDTPYLEPVLDTDIDIGINFPLSPLDLEDYLLDSPLVFCNSQKPSFRWIRIYERADLEKILNTKISKIIPLERTISGHLKNIKIIGEDKRIIKGELNIRKTLGNLMSSLFKIETKLNRKKELEFFILYGGSFGHGVGLCQEGTIGMAKRGKNYLEIINHYFPKTKIKKLY